MAILVEANRLLTSQPFRSTASCITSRLSALSIELSANTNIESCHSPLHAKKPEGIHPFRVNPFTPGSLWRTSPEHLEPMRGVLTHRRPGAQPARAVPHRISPISDIGAKEAYCTSRSEAAGDSSVKVWDAESRAPVWDVLSSPYECVMSVHAGRG